MVAVAMAFKNYPLLICIYMEMQLFISGARSATADQGQALARLEVCGRGVLNWLVYHPHNLQKETWEHRLAKSSNSNLRSSSVF